LISRYYISPAPRPLLLIASVACAPETARTKSTPEGRPPLLRASIPRRVKVNHIGLHSVYLLLRSIATSTSLCLVAWRLLASPRVSLASRWLHAGCFVLQLHEPHMSGPTGRMPRSSCPRSTLGPSGDCHGCCLGPASLTFYAATRVLLG